MGDFNNGRKDKKYKIQVLLAIEAAVIILIVIGYLFFTNYLKNKDNEPVKEPGTNTEQSKPDGSKGSAGDDNSTDDTGKDTTPTPDPEKELEGRIDALLMESDVLAKGYDYDNAIKKVESFEGDYTSYDKLAKAVEGYKAEKANLVPLGAYESVSEISHIFFHTLAADTKLTFDGDYDSNGYNYYMTTISEFNEMMQQMYDAGYVLVSIHDVANKVTKDDGSVVYEAGDIMLPPDKKPFVISQDDVNYYEYMTGDGFASRMVIDENGEPKNEMILEDGTVSVGDYDMVPILDTFIKEHPDFSYKGARGIIALTGYEGTLGYRTNDEKSPTYEADKETVKKSGKSYERKGLGICKS